MCYIFIDGFLYVLSVFCCAKHWSGTSRHVYRVLSEQIYFSPRSLPGVGEQAEFSPSSRGAGKNLDLLLTLASRKILAEIIGQVDHTFQTGLQVIMFLYISVPSRAVFFFVLIKTCQNRKSLYVRLIYRKGTSHRDVDMGRGRRGVLEVHPPSLPPLREKVKIRTPLKGEGGSRIYVPDFTV